MEINKVKKIQWEASWLEQGREPGAVWFATPWGIL